MSYTWAKDILSIIPKILHLLDQPADFRYQDIKLNFDGESGIRTHGTFDNTHTFQACALNRSAISP